MIKPETFYKILEKNKITFFTGVPDSLLKDFCAYVVDKTPRERNIIAANEGNSIGIAAGRYLGTGEISLVYMQNSGLGNCVNPLTSLTDPKVYSFPMLLLIGWRGEPGVKDEPQHKKMGEITLDLLDTMGIKYAIFPETPTKLGNIMKEALDYMESENAPFALVVRKNTFSSYKLSQTFNDEFELSREEAIKIIVSNLNPDDVVVSTTGKASRELFEIRKQLNQSHEADFLTVGSMGHSSQIAFGIALSKPEKKVYCLDGDGSLIMHMGGLSTIGDQKPKNFKHIILNNGSHDSVGGQPTVGFILSIPQIAKSCGYLEAFQVKTKKELKEKIINFKKFNGPALLEVKVNKGARKDLGRPTKNPYENKKDLMNLLKEG